MNLLISSIQIKDNGRFIDVDDKDVEDLGVLIGILDTTMYLKQMIILV